MPPAILVHWSQGNPSQYYVSRQADQRLAERAGRLEIVESQSAVAEIDTHT